MIDCVGKFVQLIQLLSSLRWEICAINSIIQ